MNTNVTVTDFTKAFTDMNREENFSVAGRVALFNYLENDEEETGEAIELDVIALCCEWTEYEYSVDGAEQYGFTFDGEETEDRHINGEALTFLEERTQVIEFDGGIIIQQF